MLSLSTEYAAQSSTKNLISDWLLELSYDSGTLYFSGQTRTVTNIYHGNVIDWGVISESIDIRNSQSSISDVEIVLANKWANESGLLSAELFGGSHKFINQDVVIKSWIPGLSLANCLTLYKGRLTDIRHDLQTVTLSIEKRSPWDRIRLPNSRESETNLLEPFAVGKFAGSVGGTLNPEDELCPVYPYKTDSNWIRSLPYPVGSLELDNLYYYEKSLDEFLRLDVAGITGAGTWYTPLDLSRDAKYRPQEIASSSSFTDSEKAIDGNGATYASQAMDASDSGDPGGSTATDVEDGLDLDFLAADHTYTVLQIYYSYQIVISTLVADSGYIKLEDHTLGTDRQVASRTSVGTSTGTGTVTITPDYDGNLPQKIQLKATAFAETAGAGAIETTGYVRIYDIQIILSTEIDFTDPQDGLGQAKEVDTLYSDNSGLDMHFTGFSGNYYDVYPHNIYRSLLKEFTSWDASAENNVKVNGANWTASIDTDKNWQCRWWTLKEIDLLAALKQLQFEGGFIWVFDETTSGREARVIYVKSSYSSTDFDIDYNDIKNIDISTTPFSEIVTKRTFNFQRHPAEDKRYLQTNDKTNANRGDYNLATDENSIEQSLDFLTASGDVDDLLTYYDNIVGEPKLVVKCDLLKPADRALQVGDIVRFTSMTYDPYGKDWTIYFMCINTQISPNKFTATFREVG